MEIRFTLNRVASGTVAPFPREEIMERLLLVLLSVINSNDALAKDAFVRGYARRGLRSKGVTALRRNHQQH